MSEFRSEKEFLAARLGFHGSVTIHSWVGISSNAMVKEAVAGTPIDKFDYPHDLGDLSRCCATFAAAPWDLKQKMLPRLRDYCIHMAPLPVPPAPPVRESRMLGFIERAVAVFR